MHLLRRYGYTVHEIERAGLRRLHLIPNQVDGEPMALVLANTVRHWPGWCTRSDRTRSSCTATRVEALAGAIVGSLTNVRVIHIEGGEVSGTIDDTIRHSISKHAHIHLVANDEARSRLSQLGERRTGSSWSAAPRSTLLTSPDAPSLDQVRSHYDIGFQTFGVLACTR